MTHPLDGPRLKVVRAREHLQELNLCQSRFFESDAYEIADQFDAQMGKHVFRISVLKNPPVHRLAALTGDCIHNLRSALDHLVWRLAEDFSGPKDDDTTTQFPIFKSEEGFEARGVNQITRVGPGATAVIRLLQPFHDDDPRVNPLWFIRELDNRDKHRELAVTAVAAKGYAHRIRPPKNTQGVWNLTIIIEDIKDGEVIAELVITPPDPEVHVETRFNFEIAFTQPTVPSTDPRLYVVPFLERLSSITYQVINCFDPFYSASGAHDDAVVLSDPLSPLHAAPPKSREPHDDAYHEEWAARANTQMASDAEKLWDRLKPILAEHIDPGIIEQPLRSALRMSGVQAFALAADMTTERVRDNWFAELELPPEGEL